MTDKLTPVRCGCGGEAEVHIMGHELINAQYYINCEKCDTRTWFFDTEAEAVTAWNKAMGVSKMENTTERTVKVERKKLTEDVVIGAGTFRKGTSVISRCSCGRWVRVGDKYCAECGAKLDWGKDE